MGPQHIKLPLSPNFHRYYRYNWSELQTTTVLGNGSIFTRAPCSLAARSENNILLLLKHSELFVLDADLLIKKKKGSKPTSLRSLPLFFQQGTRLASDLRALPGQTSIHFYLTEAREQENDMGTPPLQQRQV